MDASELKFRLKIYTYYIVIAITSLVVCIFLPMVGSDVGLGWKLPDTTVGWIVWVATKLIIASINVLLFYCFMSQAKINIRENDHYLKANEILHRTKNKEYNPRGPKEWQTQQYGKKSVMIFITSVLSVFALTQAILSFDYMALISYVFTIIFGIIFGVISMKGAELYWTEEYYDYALRVEEAMNEEDYERLQQLEDKPKRKKHDVFNALVETFNGLSKNENEKTLNTNFKSLDYQKPMNPLFENPNSCKPSINARIERQVEPQYYPPEYYDSFPGEDMYDTEYTGRRTVYQPPIEPPKPKEVFNRTPVFYNNKPQGDINGTTDWR